MAVSYQRIAFGTTTVSLHNYGYRSIDINIMIGTAILWLNLCDLHTLFDNRIASQPTVRL
jgi:hypothetical protein